MSWKCPYKHQYNICSHHHIDKSINRIYCLKTGKEINTMTQLEIYKRQLEIAKQMLENAKNNNMSSEDISMYERLCNLCESSIKKWIAANI